jgi:hypothetical protein
MGQSHFAPATALHLQSLTTLFHEIIHAYPAYCLRLQNFLICLYVTSDELLLGTCHWELGAAGLQDEMPT